MIYPDFKVAEADLLYRKKLAEALQSGTCVRCGEPAEPRCHSGFGRRHYIITGVCEECNETPALVNTEGDLFKEQPGA